MKRILSFCLCLAILSFSYFVSQNKVAGEKVIKQTQKYDVLLEAWSVDVFEGGCNSRRDFLAKTAIKFEKQNKGALVSVTSYTAEGAINALKNGPPDIISCGNGLSDFAPFAKSVTVKNGVEVLSYGKREYGVVWCRGSYFIFGNNSARLVVSQGEYTQPLLALKESGKKFEKIEVYSPQKAYSEFLKGNCSLLGTQRDFYRLNNKGIDCECVVLDGYCDLYMVALVTTVSKEKENLCKRFIAFLTNFETQNRLSEIGMISTYGYSLYKGDAMSDAEKTSPKGFTSFFTDKNILKQMQADAIKEFTQD